ncbi:MAG: DNA polymerase III subunit beta [Clostridia bacterium]|nr:DNA polymerase III subunit beta [Clostridia bacterium]
MKVIVNGLDLSSAVLTVSKAISSKTTNPVLEGIKIKASGDNLILTATDTELTIEKTINADVLMEGETVVTGRIFSEFIKKLETEQIELSKLDGEKLKIKYSDSESEMQVFPAEEFPKIIKDADDSYFELKQADFKKMVEKTVYACATDDSRPILKGCLFEIENNALTVVALDGFRMSVLSSEVLSSSGNFKAIVPARTLLEITRLISNENELIKIKVSKNALLVEVDNTVLISRLIEGEFIKYRQILPTEFITNVRVNKNLFISSIERASVVAKSDKTNVVKLDIKEDFINVTAKSEIGNVNENIAVNMDGKDIVIAFNGKYLLDYLKSCEDEFVSINLNSPIEPCVISSIVNSDYTYLIVPIRINS